MINLSELSKIVDTREERLEQEKLAAQLEYTDRQLEEYNTIISDLEKRLIAVAKSGQRKYPVAHFSAFTGNNVSEKLYSKRGNYGNYYCAWNKTIFQEDVIKYMSGNLKRVYDYLVDNKLNPIVEYWTDGGGMDEGFELVIKW